MENTNLYKSGLNGTQIKLIAAFLMVLDHIHQCFISTQFEAPLWFTYLGRIVAPLFVYLAAQGMFYTKDKKKHLIRLYIVSNLMTLGNFYLQKLFPSDRLMLTNNIFFTIFVGCWLIYFINASIKYFKSKEIIKLIISIIAIIIPFISTIIVFNLLPILGPLVLTLLPNAILCEGGIAFVLLLLAFYYGRNSKLLCIIALSVLAVTSFVYRGTTLTLTNLLNNYQWMMVFASIFIILYNGKKGRGFKYFFYIFYPAHLYILYIIGWFLAGGN